ncbi:hypothetical protein ACRE_008520 [Hapsidospora chrysogenum ATCC 11550]|uniref:F-box domain-containing protein n=1 Tax=Hapsidospora chrysogenum (strain ATCC 11550 / CBS 779.69 / DSM 880 / IAM 14645 / JCM 23072 / IMI 49137) TaxID=857340 RepID=A0A086TG85_HAPC1|nr:hypothetical protein ACRE_008520 [Hapsidospora chrysogenum ATCC 11550]
MEAPPCAALPEASYRVLAIPELLALILIHLDQRSLLTKAQRVGKRWKDVLHASPALRRHLFFYVPATEPRRPPEEKTLNPLLAVAFPPWFTQFAATGAMDDLGPRSQPRSQAHKKLQQARVYRLRGEDNPFLRKCASWMYMHVSDPPTRSVALCRARFVRRPMREKSFAHPVYYPEGLRMLHLLLLTLPESTDPREMVRSFQVLWAPPGDGGIITEAHALAARRIGMTFPPQERGSPEECAKKVGGMAAELLVEKTLSFSASSSTERNGKMMDATAVGVADAYEACGLQYFVREFAEEMKPYQHTELVLADTVSSYGTVVE